MSTNEMMLTTSDNPYNPFTQWREWYNYDVSNGYNSCGLVARLVVDDNVEIDTNALEDALFEIVRYKLTADYLLVTADSFPILFNKEQQEVSKDN